jgi:colanic acid biosynthesis glycosyl transferase WcaI
MRVLVHDFAGHPFQAQLSRQLAERGHSVTHIYALGLGGPKGRLSIVGSDPASLEIVGLPLDSQFKKYSPSRRFFSHRKYARDLRHLIGRIEPGVVLSGNTPIDVQAELLWYCRTRKIGFVHWIQDIYCHALRFFLSTHLPWLAPPIATLFERVERMVVCGSDESVAIAPDFREVLRGWNVPDSKVTVIENWAPLEEMPQFARDNAWSLDQKLGNKPVVLYSGTLGLKHRPDLLYLLAQNMQEECTVVVITDGLGRDYLTQMPALPNLRILPFQRYEQLPQVLASADVLLATLESDAGRFAVPSKILSYLCAGRPILFAGPRENLSASIIQRSGSGIVVDPNDTAAWVDSARKLVREPATRAQFASNARAYAEHTFNASRIGDCFEGVLLSAHKRHADVPVVASPEIA